MSLYPEICRVYTFGRLGSSHGQFFDQHLASIQLCQDRVNWEQQDVSHLSNDDVYMHWLKRQMEDAGPAQHWSVQPHQGTERDAQLLWYEADEQGLALAHYGLMTDDKWGLARASYQQVLIFRQNGQRVFLAPKAKILELGLPRS
jgi:alpha-1,3-mannosyl-glycoprotein beta-1,2-N-acetylglucosaminyltransferase